MEPGVAHPLYMQMGMFTMGDPLVMVNGLPGISLTNPTTGNMMNNAIGMVQVPSVTNVYYSLALADGQGRGDEPVSVEVLAALGRAVDVTSESDAVEDVRMVDATEGTLAIRRFTSAVPPAVHDAIARLLEAGMKRLLIDLRGNPGGDASAALALASDFVEPGTELGAMQDGDGDATAHRARGSAPHRFPLTLLVDRGTASAAEIFAGTLQANGRARVVGERTFGKGVMRAVVPTANGVHYTAVGRFLLPGGREIEGVGIEPDVSAG
jgi:carboxyl-terminal processing protease